MAVGSLIESGHASRRKPAAPGGALALAGMPGRAAPGSVPARSRFGCARAVAGALRRSPPR
jgi:hypothetical protein